MFLTSIRSPYDPVLHNLPPITLTSNSSALLYSPHYFYGLIFLTYILLLTLIGVVKICSFTSAPLRPYHYFSSIRSTASFQVASLILLRKVNDNWYLLLLRPARLPCRPFYPNSVFLPLANFTPFNTYDIIPLLSFPNTPPNTTISPYLLNNRPNIQSP